MIDLTYYIKVEVYVAVKISPRAISFHAKEETLSILYIPYPNPLME